VTERGGIGIAVQCDHANDDEIRRLVEQVIQEQKRIDILVNNVFMIPEETKLSSSFWDQGWEFWDACHRVGLRSHYVASCLVAPHMVKEKCGLIVNISSLGATQYLFNVAYGCGKAAVDKMAKDMAHDLKRYGVVAVSLWPGMVKTERLLQQQDVFAKKFMVDISRGAESAMYSGRAIAALAADKKAMRKTGRQLHIVDMAKEYGFTDVDGRRPDKIFGVRFLVENLYYYVLLKLFGPKKSKHDKRE